MTWPKNGFVTSGTTRATLRAAPVRSARAAAFGRYPSSAAARRTVFSVPADTRPLALPDITSETVDCETPARRATSTLVTRLSAARAMRESHHGRRSLDFGIVIRMMTAYV